MRLEQWGAGKEHYRMASEYPEHTIKMQLIILLLRKGNSNRLPN